MMGVGPPAKPSYKRWKKRLDEIVNWDRLDPVHVMTDARMEEWIRIRPHRVMSRDESRVD
jgi:hypothetical protein